MNLTRKARGHGAAGTTSHRPAAVTALALALMHRASQAGTASGRSASGRSASAARGPPGCGPVNASVNFNLKFKLSDSESVPVYNLNFNLNLKLKALRLTTSSRLGGHTGSSMTPTRSRSLPVRGSGT